MLLGEKEKFERQVLTGRRGILCLLGPDLEEGRYLGAPYIVGVGRSAQDRNPKEQIIPLKSDLH